MTLFRHNASGPNAAGDFWMITMHSSSATLLGIVHTAWENWIVNFCSGTMNALWPTETQCTLVTTYQIDDTTHKSTAKVSTPISETGTGAGQQLPPQTALTIGWVTAVTGRTGRGHVQLPPPDAGHLTANGLFVAATCDAIQAAWTAQRGTFNGTSAPVLYNRKTFTTTVISNSRVNRVPGQQRTRKNKIPATYSG